MKLRLGKGGPTRIPDSRRRGTFNLNSGNVTAAKVGTSQGKPSAIADNGRGLWAMRCRMQMTQLITDNRLPKSY
jgi:hypothetical protein